MLQNYQYFFTNFSINNYYQVSGQWNCAFVANNTSKYIWVALWQNQQNQCAPSEDSDQPVWSESSLCAQWVAKDPSVLHADSEDADQTGRMSRPESSLGAHSFCWFCYVMAHILKSLNSGKGKRLLSPCLESFGKYQFFNIYFTVRSAIIRHAQFWLW